MYEGQGFDAATNTFVPFSDWRFASDVLDALTAGMEAGIIDYNNWILQTFADKRKFRRWVKDFASYGQAWRIHDRWYDALVRLCDFEDEGNLITSEQIAETLLEQAKQTKQIR